MEEPSPRLAETVLDFWFSELEPRQHFVRDDAVDQEIANRFGALHAALSQSVPQSWREHPRSLLAAIIVLDQFSRNIFRDDSRAFAHDDAALALAKSAIAQGKDAALNDHEKPFLYMPLMHSEELADVDQCTQLMEAAGAPDNADFSRRHAETLKKFGRYPARNDALGRENTAEEAAFLMENPHGF